MIAFGTVTSPFTSAVAALRFFARADRMAERASFVSFDMIFSKFRPTGPRQARECITALLASRERLLRDPSRSFGRRGVLTSLARRPLRAASVHHALFSQPSPAGLPCSERLRRGCCPTGSAAKSNTREAIRVAFRRWRLAAVDDSNSDRTGQSCQAIIENKS